MRRFAWIKALCVFMLLGCATMNVSPDAVDLSVEFTWKDTKACSNISPEILVSNLPAEIQIVKVVLTDIDVPTWNHGGGEIDNFGNGKIPAGSLKSGYNGPCPPSGSHRYQFTVKAVDADGVIIGIGKAERKFPI
jgi:phosphatidylethanolamine-binding protein (PEBP) family uncharacterized protein